MSQRTFLPCLLFLLALEMTEISKNKRKRKANVIISDETIFHNIRSKFIFFTYQLPNFMITIMS